MNRNELTFMGCGAGYNEAGTVLFGAPFDGTTSFRPGTRFGPAAMRQESFGLESYSPYLDRDLEELSICDMGDLEFPFGNPQKVLEHIFAVTRKILDDYKLPVLMGGEHLVTLGAVRAVAQTCPDLHVIHLDAHADLRQEYLGEELSHATVLRRVWDILGDGRIHQFGIRSGTREEFRFAGEGHVEQERFTVDTFAGVMDRLRGKPLYVTIDLDVLDPSCFPGTGTPEAGGISFPDLLQCIRLLEGQTILGLDLVEISPHYDHSGISTAAACKALRELLLVCCAN